MPSSPAATRWQARPCRLCGTTLTPLQRLRGVVCQSMDCQRQAVREGALRRRDALLGRRRAAAGRAWQATAVTEAPVVWLERHETELVPLAPALREAQRAHLEHLAAEVAANPGPPSEPSPAPAPARDGASLDASLCAFCGGRCCRHGADKHAFITAELLRRWLARHPGRGPADAAAAYLALLPRRHVARSCVHHGRDGCTLPAQMRSDICNGYACDTLRAVQDAGSPAALVAAMQRDATLGDAALLQPDGFRRLPRRPAERGRQAGG